MMIVFTAVGDSKEAGRLAELLVEEKLAACVQILPPMTSVYFWEGAVQKEPEHLLLIKTLREKYEAVEAFLNEHHSYDVPEIVAVEAAEVSVAYGKWLTDYING
ncbi:MAG: divalent-cation tolerance protein CutA [Blastocatellia bacterium]|nr:divalent-cation tolerance protein CutA [Blastocatellia bacterium]